MEILIYQLVNYKMGEHVCVYKVQVQVQSRIPLTNSLFDSSLYIQISYVKVNIVKVNIVV